MNACHLVVVRQAETDWNAAGRIQGQADSPLSVKGQGQARCLAKNLQNQRFAALYSSDLSRARETMTIAMGQRVQHTTYLPCLRERHLGIFQGLTHVEAEALDAASHHAYLSNDPHFTIPSGESQQSFCSRSLQCLEDLANQHLGEDVLVITHGGVIGCLLRYTLGIPLRQVKHFRVDNAAIAHFTYSPESAWFMECWGDIRHLDERGFC